MRLAALVLAAGLSRRMGRDKLRQPLSDGRPLLRHSLEAVLACSPRFAPIIVVLGPAPGAADLLTGLPLSIVHNPTPEDGLSSSLRCGLCALPPDCQGVAVLLGDMPRVAEDHLHRLADAFAAAPHHIVYPTVHGQRGNPVLWPQRLFSALRAVTGDRGGREVLRHDHHTLAVPLDSCADGGRGVLSDVDTPDDLAALGHQG